MIKIVKKEQPQILGNARISWTDSENKYRFLLGEPSSAGENILWIGANPSVADVDVNDNTVTKIRRFTRGIVASKGWLLINLYPIRATNPNDLPKEPELELVAKNLEVIDELFKSYNISHVVCCWGNLVLDHPALNACRDKVLDIMIDNSKKLYQLGVLTQRGEPRHPARLAYNTSLNKLDI